MQVELIWIAELAYRKEITVETSASKKLNKWFLTKQREESKIKEAKETSPC